jgi:S-adenosylmethionine hydrolase
VTLASSDNQTVTPTTVTLSNGVPNVTVTLDKAGSIKLKASAGSATGSSNSIVVSPLGTDHFVIANMPSAAAAGSSFSMKIIAEDVYGNTATSNDNPVTVTALAVQDSNWGPPAKTLTLTNGSVVYTTSLTCYGNTTSDNFTITAMEGKANGSSSIMITAPQDAVFVPPSVYDYSLYVYSPSGKLISEPMTQSTTALDDADAQVYIANQESLAGQELVSEGFDVGLITTTNESTGITTVTKTLIGQTTSMSEDLAVSRNETTQSTAGPAVSFALTVPTSAKAGTKEPVTVTALDANGNVATGYTGTVTLGSNDLQAAVPDSYTFTTADQGSHVFYVFLNTAGGETLTATDTGSGTQNAQAVGGDNVTAKDAGASTISGQAMVDITPAQAASLVLSAPSTTTTGSAAPIAVTALDNFGNVATGFTGKVSFSSNNQYSSQANGLTGKVVFSSNVANAVLPPSYTFTSADQGNHDFAVTFKSTGSQTIMASDSAASTINGLAPLQVVAAPAKLVIASQPTTAVTTGSVFGLVVDAVNSQGHVVGNFNGLVTLTLAANPGGSTLGGAVSFQAVDGVATFPGLTLNKVGAGYSLKASSGSIPGATTGRFNVTPGAAAKVVLMSQPPSKVGAASPFGLKVAVEDAEGNVISSYTGSVTLALATNPGGGTLGGKLTVAAVKGVATFSALKLTQAASGYSLTASSGSLATATTALFTVTPGAATHFTISTQPPGSVTAGSGFGLVVTALDAYGNVASSYSGNVTLALATNPTGNGILGGKVTVKAVGGVATFKGLTLNIAANGYLIQTKSGNLPGDETSSFDVVS